MGLARGWVGLAAGALVISALAPARAQTAPAPPDVKWGRDGAITGAALVGYGLATLIPVDDKALWQRQLLPIDDRLKGRLSVSAALTSDVLGAIDVFAPLGLLVGQGGGLNEANVKRLLLYAESVSVSVFANGVTKYVVGRPRPYAYSDDPRVQEYAAVQGTESRLSFFSGHASTTFAASVAGAYIYSQYSPDKLSRAAVWSFELVLAGATADLRLRAGKHFYSDVIVGAILGAGIGFLVPYLHGGPAYHPSSWEWAATASAPVAGGLLAQLLPAKPSVTLPLAMVALPWVAPGSGGLMLARRF
jgi:hypothetical protein